MDMDLQDVAPKRDRWRLTDWQRGILLVAIVLIVLAYWNGMQGEFVYDDTRQIVENIYIQQRPLYLKALTSDVWAFKSDAMGVVSNYYRPVFVLSMIINHELFKLDPLGWHIVNLLLHIAATVLVFFLLLRLQVHQVACALITWIFAVHPVHVESVTWVAGETDLLMAVFLLGSYLSYLSLREQPSLKMWSWTLLLFLLALGSKEVAIAMLGFVFVTEWVYRSPEISKRTAFGQAFRKCLPFLGVGILFFAVRHVVLQGSSIQNAGYIGPLSMLATIPKIVIFYLRQIFLPYQFGAAYGVRAVSAQTFGFMTVIMPVLFLMLIGRVLIWLLPKHKAYPIALAFFLFPLLPALNIRVFWYEHLVRDRYLYLPLLGALILFIDPLVRSLSSSRRFAGRDVSPAFYAIGCVASLGLALISMNYNRVWLNEVALWESGVRTDPNSLWAHMQLAEAYRHAGQLSEAEAIAQKGLVLSPHYNRLRAILGLIYKAQGRNRDAVQELLTVLRQAKESELIVLAAGNLAKIYQDAGNYDDAIRVLQEATVRAPDKRAINSQNVAILQALVGKSKEALATLESTRDLLEKSQNPDVLKSWYYMGELYRELEQPQEAKEAYRHYLKQTTGMASPGLNQTRDLCQRALEELGEQ
jgi:tetratricopeptide (TPR) repeat protein